MGVNHWALGEDAMEGMAALWGYQETKEDLKQKLLYTTFELENAKEEMRKNQDYINQLTELLKITSQERDEAREQIQLLLKRMMPSNPVEISPIASYLQPESPPIKPSKGNSSITESDSLSGTPNHQSYVSSPVDSLFDATVASPEFSNMNMADSCNIAAFPEYSKSNSLVAQKFDEAAARIEQLVGKKPLPEKGNLLQAVMEAGPLLQTLRVAGPLPRWRNPPPLQPLEIPPISIRARSSQQINQHAVMSPMASPCVSSYQSFGGAKRLRSQ